MRDTWLVKGFEYVLRQVDPAASDSGFANDYIWINTVTDIAFVMTTTGWIQKAADSINTAGVNLIYVIDTIAASVVEDDDLLFIDRDDFEFIDQDDFTFIDR